MIAKQYSLQDFQKIKNVVDEMKTVYSLSEIIQNIIKDLENQVAIYSVNIENNEKPRKHIEKQVYIQHDKRSGYHGEKKHRISIEEIDNWNVGKSFEVIPKVQKEGIEKIITEIRMALNKITIKNIETQKNVIIKLICKVSEESENIDEDMKKITRTIFDIASSNKILSELYAELYKQLMEKFDIFKQQIIDLIYNYKNSLNEIHYVDPNSDYDAFCKYNKTNDMRKAMITFIVNLFKKGIVKESILLEMIVYIEDMILKYAKETNRTNEVEEITENLFILISQTVSIFKNVDEWCETIIPKIHELSKLKKNHGSNFPSMTNRASFKYMDILDSLN
jgi:hypothetical protein